MPTIISHAVVPLALGLGLGRQRVPTRLLVAGITAAILPDLDVIAFRLGIAYSSELGHRGFSHSLAFALLLAVVAWLFARQLKATRRIAFFVILAAGASHGLLDMLTNGGLGIALLWPLSDQRYFFPEQVIQVSPLSLRRIFGPAGLAVLKSELLWVWLPATVAALALLLARWRRMWR